MQIRTQFLPNEEKTVVFISEVVTAQKYTIHLKNKLLYL